MVQSAVHAMGFKWRKIASMLPNRSDDAVRNRWHRLELCRRYQEEKQKQLHLDPTGQSVGYKCSLCGQPKKHHICLAPDDSRVRDCSAPKRRRKLHLQC
mmetsp:Transcript_4985/g.11368  ORF Transcript_4985/g.11368 Transcript_4985/m.11368 type:complete len:99 (-) Transcript_4985:342-638(-)